MMWWIGHGYRIMDGGNRGGEGEERSRNGKDCT
jgi:hypothetical protein